MSSVEFTNVDLVATLVRRQGEELLKVRKDLEDSKNLFTSTFEVVSASKTRVEDAMKGSWNLQRRLRAMRSDLADLQTEHEATLAKLEVACMDLRAVVGSLHPEGEQTVAPAAEFGFGESLNGHSSLSTEASLVCHSFFGLIKIFHATLLRATAPWMKSFKNVNTTAKDPERRPLKMYVTLSVINSFCNRPRVDYMTFVQCTAIQAVAGESSATKESVGVEALAGESVVLVDNESATESIPAMTTQSSNVSSVQIAISNPTFPSAASASTIVPVLKNLNSIAQTPSPSASASDTVPPQRIEEGSAQSKGSGSSAGLAPTGSIPTVAAASQTLDAMGANTNDFFSFTPKPPSLVSTPTVAATPLRVSRPPSIRSTWSSISSPTLKAPAIAPVPTRTVSYAVAAKSNTTSSASTSSSSSSTPILQISSSPWMSVAFLKPICTQLPAVDIQNVAKSLCLMAIGSPEQTKYEILRTPEVLLTPMSPTSTIRLYISVWKNADSFNPTRFGSDWKGHVFVQDSMAKHLFYLGEYKGGATCKLTPREYKLLPDKTKQVLYGLAKGLRQQEIRDENRMLLSLLKDDGIHIARTELLFMGHGHAIENSLRQEAKKRKFV
ncbi:hypothetical protein F5890DRAFT_1546504 [Lentinula detonsa]|uniref:Uncharacterized protein n=1 Tax=Lentinula detonsa TaxID=2804962 RepID=A0AA38PQ11_9AGAR|nr:hypothetical protein F5890DRAFT_1546504 [Lentinula detonsa]